MYAPTFERVRGRLAADLPSISVTTLDEQSQLQDRSGGGPGEPQAAWASSDLYLDGPVRDFMVACLKSKALRFFQTASAGVEHPVFTMLAENGAVVANSHANAPSVAEFAIGAVFDAFACWEQRRAYQRQGLWRRQVAREVHGSRFVVVGLGAIGRAIAERLRALGGHVTGVRRTPRDDDPVDRTVTPAALRDVVSDADAVIVCAAANPDNQHMFDTEVLSRMRGDTVFINVARGSLVDEEALVAALDRGAPGRAYLDVFAREPLVADSPLWKHPKVHVSAHCAAAGRGTHVRNDDLFVENMRRVMAGQGPRNRVTLAELKAATLPSWTAR